VGDLCDWDHMCAVLADEEPWWEPGPCFGYHAKTFGFPLGEIMRRATGRTISTLLRDVVTGPLGVEDDIPSEGTMTARGVAWMYSALLGHVGGVALVSPRRLANMAALAFTGMDQVMGFPTAWAFGYSPDRPGGVPSRPGSTFGMVGMNGSAAYADIDSGVAVAMMRNRFASGDLTTAARIDRLVAEATS
jgi:CubicO group peptidase (beta-lactamase class C family)